MTKLQILEGQVLAAKETLRFNKQRCDSIKRELDKAEDIYISQREVLIKAEEVLDKYKRTEILTTVDEDLKAKEIQEFRDRLPGVMAIVDAQDKVREEKDKQVELLAFRQKIIAKKVVVSEEQVAGY